MPNPKGPCTQVVIYIGPNVPTLGLLEAQSICYLGTWTLRERKQATAILRRGLIMQDSSFG